MTIRNGDTTSTASGRDLLVQIEQRSKAMAVRLAAAQVTVDALDPETVPTAAAISAAIAADVARLNTYGVDPANPFPS